MQENIIYAITADGELTQQLDHKDGKFYGKRVITSYPCSSYTYDEYFIVDIDGNPIQPYLGNYEIVKIKTSGCAQYYTLSITVRNSAGEEYTQQFVSDIRYNLPFDYNIIQKKEWDVSNPFTVIVPFLDDLNHYGIGACKKIYDLQATIYEEKIEYQYADLYRQFFFHIAESAEEISFAEGLKEIYRLEFTNFSKLKCIILPSTLTTIYEYAFNYATNVERIICRAVNPPEIKLWMFKNIREIDLFVPEKSIDAYDKKWNRFGMKFRIKKLTE